MPSLPALFGFDPPELTLDEALDIAGVHWGVAGQPRRLAGERSHNTRLDGPDGRAWTLQVQAPSADPVAVDLQTRAMRHLEARVPDVPVPRIVPTATGHLHAEILLHGRPHLARLVTFLPGVTFEGAGALPVAAYRRIGRLIGRIAVGLSDFEHPGAAHLMPWDIANGLIVDVRLRSDLSTAAAAALAAIDDRLHDAHLTMATLPRRTIHNDGHAGNLLRPDARSDRVTGVIDFGDLVRTVTAADVAIIAESFAPEHPDPAGVVAAAAAGYHAELPLLDRELDAVPELVLARAALSVLLAEHHIRHVPHLASRAAANLPDVIERLVRWSRLDTGAMIARIHEAVDASPDDPPTEAAP